MKKCLSTGVSLLWLVAAPEAFAWGAKGHQVVAAIAEHHLTPQARDGLQILLGSAHLHDQDIAAWADDIRASQPETQGWHYVDIPRSADTYLPARDCKDGLCVVEKIEAFRHPLADPGTSPADKLTALKFLVHFVGDLHQPLHCINDNDQGGNELAVRYSGRLWKTNLHSVWDSLILQDAMGEREVVDFANALNASLTQADLQAWTSSNSPASWTNEVHQTAQNLYRELPAANALGQRVLPKTYGADHQALVEQQLQRGGIRLASLLNDAFAATAADPAPAQQSSLDPSRIAAHLESELTTAVQAIESHGTRMEALLASPQEPSSGTGLTLEARTLRAALPALIRDNPHLFEELLGDLQRLERHEHLDALPLQGREMTARLLAHLRQGIIRFGNRVGAPPALVVSGGVSLGSYQAGFLYYYTLFLHDRARVLRAIPPEHRMSLRALGLELPEDPPSGFTIVTGASAGSVNALLSAYTGCREPERTPSKSLFFQTWNTLALEALLQPGSVGLDHAFSSKPITEAMDRLKSLEPDGWRRCRFSLGATTTRLQSREIDLAQAARLRDRTGEPLRLSRYTEKFLLTAQGARGVAPDFCPFPGCTSQPPPGSLFYPRLAQPEGSSIPLDNVFNMVAASGAFPTAFEPRAIPHRYFDSRGGQWVDDAATRFADGGIFNNNPLDLALRMSQWETPALRGSHRFLYFDPNAVDWKWSPEQAQPWTGPGLLSTFENLLTGFADTAMSAQLMDTLEAEPEVRERIDVPIRHTPLAGEYLLSMSAFLDEDFRTFDFHRGMVDAWHFVAQESDTRILFDELAHANPEAPPTTVEVDSPLFDCFLAFEQSQVDEPATLPVCGRLQEESSRNILSLMAVTRKMGKDPSLSQSNKFERFTQALAARSYTFRSGLLKGQRASALQDRFRQVFGDAVAELTHQQPPSQRLGFQVATKLALDSAIAYQPVALYTLVGLTSGGLELAASPSLTHWNEKELRLRAGLRVSYGESARFSGGVSPPDVDTAAYVSGSFGFGLPPIRFEVGAGLLTEASYIPETKDWVAVRFAAEGSLMLVAAEHLEISFRPRLYLDRGRTSSSLYVPTTERTDAPEKFESVGLLLGAGWRF